MNDADRISMARIDERTLNIWRVTEAQDKKLDHLIEHQAKQNGWIMRNTIYRRIMVSIGGATIMTFILHLIGVY
ncbi:hypothetical protein LCGC14_1883260 [marine sediment metagenome]|uniref:Uncharacterized protein n=1 Tax=marine sediment metagenome TaxID=412755 RepID=A0A0F9IFK4_9ZZZZ